MSLQAPKHLIDGQFADVETARAYAEWERRREEEEKKKREEEEKRQAEQRQEDRQAERREERQSQREERQQPQTLEEESALIRQKLEEERRRREEEQRRREEEERRRREEEERRRQEEERRRREEEERRRRVEEERRLEEEKRRREEEERRRQEELRRQVGVGQRQPQSVEEESALVRQKLEEQRQRQAQQRQPEQPAPEDGKQHEGGGKDRQQEGGRGGRLGFDDVVEVLREAKDPERAVERLREMGLEVEEVSERAGDYTYRYGWVVKVGDRYAAITSGHRVGYGDVGDYAAVELPDKGLARNFLVGRYWGTSWGDPEFVGRAAEAALYERGLDRWMKEELGRAGYRVERVDWGPNAAVPGFTYVIYDREGRKVGEVQVAKLGFRHHLVDTGLPPAVTAAGDPRRAALYLIYRRETGDENLAWRLAIGDERAKEQYLEKARHEEELKIRGQWFEELTQRGLKPIAYSKVDGRAVVSENDLWLDEKTGATYRVVLGRQDGKVAMKLVPASERDERLLALKSLEAEGFKVIDDKTVEKDGIRYVVGVEERDGKKALRLEPHPEDVRKAAEREAWWELWRQGFVRRGEYAVKDGVKYRVEVAEQDGRYVAKLTPVGPAEEEPRRYRRGDWRGSLESLRQMQFTIEKFGFEKPLTPEELAEGLRFGGRRPRDVPKDVPYFPVLDEAFYGAFGVPLSQLSRPAGRELYQRYATATLPGPRVEGFTLPERQALERAAEIQRIYAERLEDVWTPLTLRAPKAEDVNWRTAVATAAEAFTFWIPVVKGATALAAAKGLRVPGLTVEKTAASGYGVRLPRVPGDYFGIHFVEPRKVAKAVKGALVAEGVGEGAAVRGGPGHWEFAFARSAGAPTPGWAFEFATATYRDVAEWLKKIPSIGIRTELKPKITRFAEVRGFARDRFEVSRFESQPKGREVKVEWVEPKQSERPLVHEPKPAEPPAPKAEPPRRVGGQVAKVEEAGLRAVAKAEEELARPIRAEVPVAQPVRVQLAAAPSPKTEEEEETARRIEGQRVERAEEQHISWPAPFEVPVRTTVERSAEERAVAQHREVPLRELELAWRYEFTTPAIYPFELRTFETQARAFEAASERELETPRYDAWTAEVPGRGVRTAETGRYVGRAEGFATPPAYVRGGYGWGRDSAHVLHRPPRLVRRGWRAYEVLRI